MSEQLSLLDVRYPYAPPHRGEPSQLEGARKIAPKTPRLQSIVLEAIDALGTEASIENIVSKTGLKLQTVCGRIGELKHLGRISEAAHTVKSEAGVSVKVWARA